MNLSELAVGIAAGCALIIASNAAEIADSAAVEWTIRLGGWAIFWALLEAYVWVRTRE